VNASSAGSGDVAKEAGVFKTNCACAVVRPIRKWERFPHCPSCDLPVTWSTIGASPDVPRPQGAASDYVQDQRCSRCGGALRASPITPDVPDGWIRVLCDGTFVSGRAGPGPTEAVAAGSAFCTECGATFRFIPLAT
jgi:hypothetical protein